MQHLNRYRRRKRDGGKEGYEGNPVRCCPHDLRPACVYPDDTQLHILIYATSWAVGQMMGEEEWGRGRREDLGDTDSHHTHMLNSIFCQQDTWERYKSCDEGQGTREKQAGATKQSVFCLTGSRAAPPANVGKPKQSTSSCPSSLMACSLSTFLPLVLPSSGNSGACLCRKTCNRR